MSVKFDLCLGFWSRVKLLFGYPLHVNVDHLGDDVSISIVVKGEETTKAFRFEE